MNILQVSHSFIPCYDSGGVVRSVYTLSKELASRGHNVTVYTTDGCTKRLDVEKNKRVSLDGVNVYYFSNISNTLRMRFKIATPYHLLRIIGKTIKNYDVIHIHEQRTIIALIVAYYAKKNNIPIVIHARGSTTLERGRVFYKKVFDTFYGKKMVKNASKLIALTPAEAQQYQEIGADPQKIVIIPNAIETSLYDNLPPQGNFREKHNIQANEKMVLFLGRLNQIKGVDLLVESFALLTNDIKDSRLVIVGPDDGCLDHLEEMINRLKIKSKVLFTGPLYEDDKLEAYVDADVYVLPSRYETFPNTVLEAAICKTPVIVTERCGIAEMVKNNMGLVVKYDKESLKKGIYILLTAKSDAFKDKGYSFVREKFSQKVVVDEIENIYRDLQKR
jgi:glycosyltransferase involved in cell wall biosynthesis